MKRLLFVAACFAGHAFAQCGPNGKFLGLGAAGDVLCTGKTGAAGYTTTFAAVTGLSVTAATHGQGVKPVGFCYDNATPANLIAQTSGFPTVSAIGDVVFAWSGSKTGYCVVSALGTAVGPAGANGANGAAGATGATGATGAGGATGATGATGASGGISYGPISVTAQTSATVAVATHGASTSAVAVCFDNSTPAHIVSCDWTRNASGDIVFSWSPAFTGSYQIFGPGGGGGGGSGSVTSVATTSPISGGTITSTGTLTCPTCVVSTSPGAGLAHFAGSTQTVTSSTVVNADIANSTIDLTAKVTGILPKTNGGTGVNNSATLTLGSSNQNWATLGTGIVKNTTTTGAISNAASADVVGVFSGTPNGSKFLRDDGALGAAGDVVGPSSATDNAVARFDTTTGKLIQNSSATIDDSGNVTATSYQGDSTKNAADYFQGGTSGGVAWSVANVAGTAVTLLWPTDSSSATTGTVLAIGGTTTCPTLLPSYAPATCRTTSWATGATNPASVVTATFSATPTFTCPSSSAGTVTTFNLSTALTANITSSTLATCTTGQTLHFIFTQDGTGGRTVAMPSGFDSAPVDPTASTTTTLTYAWDGTSGHLINSSSGTASVLYLTERSAAATPASGKSACWPDSTNHVFSCKANNASTVSNTVVPNTGTTHQFVTAISAAGVVSTAALAATDLPPAAVPTPGTSITLAAPAGYAICTGTCTVSVPVPAAGYQFCVRNDTGVSTAITLSALGSSAMYENTAGSAYGTAGTGTLVATAAAGNKVCLVGRDATHYQVYSFTGTWTAN
jgi:collagen type VII alpha